MGKAVIWGLMVVGAADFMGSFLFICHIEEKLPRLLGWNHKLQRWTFRLATKVSGHIEKRIGRSYPAILREKEVTVRYLDEQEQSRMGAVQRGMGTCDCACDGAAL